MTTNKKCIQLPYQLLRDTIRILETYSETVPEEFVLERAEASYVTNLLKYWCDNKSQNKSDNKRKICGVEHYDIR